jgi:hypothetical protein
MESGPAVGAEADSVLMTLLGLQPYQLGPVAIRPHALYRFSYSDGIEYQPGRPLSSIINELTPGLLFNIGTHWSIDYSPSWIFYSNEKLRDSLDQSLRLNGGTTYRDWLFTLSHTYQATSSSRVETAQQTDQQINSTSLAAFYQANSSISVELNASQNIRLTDQFTTVYSWSTLDYLNYYLGSRLSFGLGAGVGYDDVDQGVDMTSGRLQGRFSWLTTDKTSFQVNGGFEDRQFLGAGVPDLITPTFGVSLGYRPFQFTSLALSANRSVTPPYFQNQATEITAVSANLTQRLLGHFTASITGSYNTAQYVAAAQGVAAGRHDTYYSLNTRLSWLLLKQFSMSLF